MKTNLEEYPWWFGRALQGVIYWIGHRRSLYRYYNLPEKAIVAELCNLLHANKPDIMTIRCEIEYSKLCKITEEIPELTKHSKADIVIYQKSDLKTRSMILKYIIEVKRESAGLTKINADLKRLVKFHQISPTIRTFLIVISEAKRPKLFVSSNGISISGKKNIPDCNGYYYVRRTFKAIQSFKKVDKAHYACLIEVF
jgi:hypothetical protein